MEIRTRQCQGSIPLSEDIHPLLDRVYRGRGVTHPDEIDRNLTSLPLPTSFKGLDDAIALLKEALLEQQRVLVVGDFDADGATSTALMILALQGMGLKNIDYLVPNRFEYGYGLTPEIVSLAQGMKPDLIITVDNGISSIEGVERAKSLGIKVLITDHHLPGNTLPAADATVNPNQPGCLFPCKNLAGVGVAFYLLSALRSHLRESGWFEQQQLPEPNMASWLDLVALGTVADVVALDKTNRTLVHQGLARIKAGKARPGILALLSVAGRAFNRLSASDLGFVLGPRINAAGRLDDMSLGIQCLLTDSQQIAHESALQLDELNRDRKVIEAGMQREGEAILSKLNLANAGDLPWGICLYDESWHQGVVGLLASRIKEKTHRPVIAFARENESQLKGSARSIAGFHIRDALDAIAARNQGMIEKFGGHAMAAGLSLATENFSAFSLAFDELVKEWLCPEDLQAECWTDGELPLQGFTLATAKVLAEGGPWGQHFPEPLFSGEFHLLDQRIVGGNHLKMQVAPAGNQNQTMDAIAFNVDTRRWPDASATRIRLVYKLDINFWRDRENLQLLVDYLEDT